MGDFNYTGTVVATSIPEAVVVFSFSYVGDIVAQAIPESVIDRPFSYVGTIEVVVDSPSDENIQVETFPFVVYAIVRIDGEDYSPILSSVLRIRRETDVAASFSFSVMSNLKPASFLNRNVALGMQVADGNGTITVSQLIMTGIIKNVRFDADTKEYSLSGYDYGGKHGTKGDFVSDDITPVLTGTIFIDSDGTKAVGQDPIWGVQYLGADDIVDGRDYFVNPLAGEIEVPLSSRLVDTPGTLQYSYSNYFTDTEELLKAIVGRKGWSLDLSNFTFREFTNKKKQPIISLSDESVIDVARKIIEISGGRVETNGFPIMRLYSDYDSFVGAASYRVSEDDIFENTLSYTISLDDLITTQEVKSAAKAFPNIEISSEARILTEEGISEWFPVSTSFFFDSSTETQAHDLAWDHFVGLQPREVVTVSVSKRNINSVTVVASGDFFWRPSNSWTSLSTIFPSDWVRTGDEDNLNFTLSIKPHMVKIAGAYIVFYEGADYSIGIDASEIEYGQGTLDEIVAVTVSRPVTGISETLTGDVYEHAYIETAGQAETLSNAILLESGNFYQATFETPVFKSKTLNLGRKIEIYQNEGVQFVGVVNSLVYNVNYAGASSITVGAKGIGKTI